MNVHAKVKNRFKKFLENYNRFDYQFKNNVFLKNLKQF